MKDRFVNGLVAGIVAGFVQIAVSAFLYFILHFGHLKLGDFAGIILFGRKPANLMEYQMAFIAHLGYVSRSKRKSSIYFMGNFKRSKGLIWRSTPKR